MPNLRSHNLFDMHFFGCEYGTFEWIHDAMDHGDIDYVRLFGTKHRHFMHDDRTVEYFTTLYGPTAGMVAHLHICLDLVWTNAKKRLGEEKKKGKN